MLQALQLGVHISTEAKTGCFLESWFADLEIEEGVTISFSMYMYARVNPSKEKILHHRFISHDQGLQSH
jgi:hypothetical protein